MPTVDVTTESFEQTITDNPIVLVDFWAEWCGPCKQFAPVFEKASGEHSDITFAKVDTEAEQDLAAMAGIQAIPTLMAFRDGIMVFNQAGALPGSSLQQLIDGVKKLDMDEVRTELAKQQAEQPDDGAPTV